MFLPPERRRAGASEAGATLIEVMIAATILALGLAGILQAMRYMAKAREVSSYYDSSKYLAAYVKTEVARVITKELEDSKGAQCAGNRIKMSTSLVARLNAATPNLRFSQPNLADITGRAVPPGIVSRCQGVSDANGDLILGTGSIARFCLRIEFMNNGLPDKEINTAMPWILGNFSFQLIDRRSGAPISCAQFADFHTVGRGFALHYNIDYQFRYAEPGPPSTWQNPERYGHVEGDFVAGGHELN